MLSFVIASTAIMLAAALAVDMVCALSAQAAQRQRLEIAKDACMASLNAIKFSDDPAAATESVIEEALARDGATGDLRVTYVELPESQTGAGRRVAGVYASLSEGLAVPASAVQGASTSTLAQAVGDGMVAYSVAVSTDDGLAGLLRVGDRVNVLAGVSGAEAAVVAEDVRVLALDASTTTPAQAGYATVTIEVTPDEATELFDLLDVAGGTCHLTMPPATEAAQGAM